MALKLWNPFDETEVVLTPQDLLSALFYVGLFCVLFWLGSMHL